MQPDRSVQPIECAVVGAGWAGLAAAIGLVHAGRQVMLLDAAPQAGGRARSLNLQANGTTLALDNGQHLLIGGYCATLALLRRIDLQPDTVLRRFALQLHSVQGLHVDAGRWPGRAGLAWGLLRARGLSAGQRLAAARLLATLPSDTDRHWPRGLTVSQWLKDRGQPEALIERLWRPVCVGALNTALHEACARTFARVLRDTFRAAPDAFDMLLARGCLGAVLPDPALAWLRARGAAVHLRRPVRALERTTDQGWTLQTDQGPVAAHQVVLALPPRAALRLIDPLVQVGALPAPSDFQEEPIATVWLAWHDSLSLPDTLLLHDDMQAGAPGQWLFNRPDATGSAWQTVAGVVVSAAGHTLPDPQTLADQVNAQVSTQLAVPPAPFARTIVERQATQRCTPNRPRIDRAPLRRLCPGLELAGDWMWPDYPSTIESAVRSGNAAAQALLGQSLPRPAG